MTVMRFVVEVFPSRLDKRKRETRDLVETKVLVRSVGIDFLVQFSVSCTDLLPPITAPASRNGRYKTGFDFAASCSCGGGLLGSGEGRRCGAHGFDLLG
jgi:hypothetical protein